MIVQRQRHDWRIGDRGLTLGARTLIMGVVSLEGKAEGERADPPPPPWSNWLSCSGK